MKHLTLFLFICTVIVVWSGHALGDGGRWWSGKSDASRQEWGSKQGGEGSGGAGKRYCSGSEEKGLLDLLRQLEQQVPKDMRGGYSDVRRKYRIVRRLRTYDDCRAEEALERLSRENSCEEQGDGEVLCLKWSADTALEEIKASADLEKLVATTPIGEQLKVVRKYTKRPYINDFAVNKIAKYLTRQSSDNPEIFVPLLVELFPRKPSTEKIARRYPLLADKGLEKVLASKEFDEVWWGINMARFWGRAKFMDSINAVAFAQKGRIDYSNPVKVRQIQAAALNFFRVFLPESLPYLRRAQSSATGLGGYCSSATKGCKKTVMINRYLADLADNSSGFAVTGSIGVASGSGDEDVKEIAAILISERASWDNDHNRPTVIITGAIHGNEWATPEVCLGIAEYLLENRDNDQPAQDDNGALINEKVVQLVDKAELAGEIIPKISAVKELLRAIQVIIIPVFNPDGYDYSHTPEGRNSYYGAGWRPNRRSRSLLNGDDICYRQDGSIYPVPPDGVEYCFLADYDDSAAGGELEEEEVVVCEGIDRKTLHLFEPSFDVASDEMFDAIYTSVDPIRVVCASSHRRVWKGQWGDEGDDIKLSDVAAKGYLQDSYGVDLNRNYKYKWDVVDNQKNLFIRSRSPSSRLYRGRTSISEGETSAIEKLIAKYNVVALIDYHSGSTQVLYPYAYSTTKRADKNLFGKKWGRDDYEVFRKVSGKIVRLLNRHESGSEAITGYTASQNYNGTSVGSGVARDCYYQSEGIAALNIEVHDRRYIYEHEEFATIVPEICKTNVPGAIWFLFWAAELEGRQQ